jgi:hypothetical protein
MIKAIRCASPEDAARVKATIDEVLLSGLRSGPAERTGETA